MDATRDGGIPNYRWFNDITDGNCPGSAICWQSPGAQSPLHFHPTEKETFVLAFIRDYRSLAVRIGRAQWWLFFEAGSTNKQAPAKHLNDICGAAPVQMASYQVQEQMDGWVSNRANDLLTA